MEECSLEAFAREAKLFMNSKIALNRATQIPPQTGLGFIRRWAFRYGKELIGSKRKKQEESA